MDDVGEAGCNSCSATVGCDFDDNLCDVIREGHGANNFCTEVEGEDNSNEFFDSFE